MANEFIVRKGFRSKANSDLTGSLAVAGAVTASYFSGDGSALTNLPVATGLLSSSAQIATEISGAFAADSSSLASRIGSFEGAGIVSASAQIDHDAIANFVSGEHFLQSAITTVGTVTTGDVSLILPTGIFSGSQQLPTGLVSSSQWDEINDDISFTGSVAIGTPSPSMSLDVHGDARVTGSLQVTGSIWIEGTYFGDGSGLTGVGGSGGDGLWVSGSDNDIWYTAGQVSIGKSNPVRMLDVEGNARILSELAVSGSVVVLGNVEAPQLSGSMSGSFEGNGSGLTNLASANFDNNTVSYGGVTVALGASDATPAFDLADATNYPYSSVAGVPEDIVSSSAQIATEISGAFVADSGSLAYRIGVFEGAGIVSASAQIDHDATTNFDANEHFLQSAITEVGTVTTGNVNAILPSGIISSSLQFPSGVISSSLQFQNGSDPFSGSFSGSFEGDGSGLTGIPAGALPVGLVSASAQIDHDTTTNFDANEHFLQSAITTVGTVTTGNVDAILPTGIVSSSLQLPSGLVSASAQIDHDATTNFVSGEHFLQSAITTVGTVTTGDVSAILPENTVSSSVQIATEISGAFAADSSSFGSRIEVFEDATIISASAQIDHDLTTNFAANEHFTQGAIVTVGTVTTGDISAILPENTVSASAQIATEISGAFVADSSSLASRVAVFEGITIFSASAQVDHDSTENYVAGEHFLQSAITTVGTVTTGNVDAILPSGIISSSLQFPTGVVSASAQIDHDSTTNFVSGEHFLQSAITTVGTVTTGNVDAILPTGIVSSSLQFQTITDPFTGSFTGSFIGDGSNLTGLSSAAITTYTNATNNRVVTSVDATSVNSEANLTFNGSVLTVTGDQTTTGTGSFGRISGSHEGNGAGLTNLASANLDNNSLSYGGVVVSLGGADPTPAFDLSDATDYAYSALTGIPVGLVSASAQIDHDATTNFDANEHFAQSAIITVGTVTAGNVDAILPTGILSSSLQLPIGLVSASAQIDHDATTNFDANEHFLQSAITTVGTVTAGNVSAILPENTVSSSAQIADDISGSAVIKTYTNSGNNRVITSVDDSSVNSETNLTFDGMILSVAGTVEANQLSGSFSGSFEGDGSNLTGLPSAAITSYTNAGDNRVVTSVNATDVNAESNLTFDGTVLNVIGNVEANQFSGSFSGSFHGDGGNLTGVGDPLPEGVISSSAQISSDISGSFFEVSESLAGRVTVFEDATIVSASAQIDHDATINYVSGEHFLQSAITTVGTVTTGNVDAILPTGIVSSSLQLPLGIVSASSQIDHDLTINFDSNEHFLQSAITEVGTVISGDVNAILPTGVISSSLQLPSGILSSSVQIATEISGAFVADSSSLAYRITVFEDTTVVSASAQIDHDATTNFDANEHFLQSAITEVGTVTTGNVDTILPTGIISSSLQLPVGIVSASAQIDHDATINYVSGEHFLQSAITTVGTVTTGDVSAILPENTVSSSAQIAADISGSSVIQIYTNAGNNRIVTSVDGSTINAEANLTFDGSVLNVTGNVEASQISGSFSGSLAGNGSSITNLASANLDNNTVNFGGVTVALGSGDTTPAFDLSDATDYAYGSLTGIPVGLVSASAQIDHDATANYLAGEHFTQDNITEVGTVTTGNVDAILPTGIISASVQIATEISGAFVADSSSLASRVSVFEGAGIISASAQIDHDATTNFDANEHFVQSAITTVGAVTTGDVSAILPENTVSASAQIDHDTTTNYVSEEHFLQSAITTVGTVTTGNVNAILPTGIVSSSLQFQTITDPFTGSFTGSFTGDGSKLTNLTSTNLDNDSVSYGGVSVALGASDATPAFDLSDATNYSYDSLTGIPVGIISSSLQLPSGIVSSSVQIDHDTTTNYVSGEHFLQSAITTVGTVTTGDVSAILPESIVSSSAQIETEISGAFVADSSSLASRISTFEGAGIISASSQVDHDLTTNYIAGEHFVQSAITTIGTVTSGNVNAILPAGIVSSSLQLPTGLVSASSQIAAEISGAFYADSSSFSSRIEVFEDATIISASSQVDHDLTTNYVSGEHFLQSAITTVGTVTTGDVSAILPENTVSSSAQIADDISGSAVIRTYANSGNNRVITSVDDSSVNSEANLTFDGTILGVTGNVEATRISGSMSGSFEGDGSGLTGLASAAIDAYTNASNNRVVTSVDATSVNAEANLTFDGNVLSVTGNVEATRLSGSFSGSFEGDGSGLTGIAGGGGDTIYYNTMRIDQSGGTSDTHGAITGSVDGVNTLFQVSRTLYATGTLKVFVNGQLQTQGTSEDWYEDNPAQGTFLFVSASTPQNTDNITTEYVIQGNDTGSFIANVVEDATPQLGGDLDANTYNIVNAGQVSGSFSGSFSGDGSALTGLSSAAISTYNTTGANEVITTVSSNEVVGESNLLFDGTILTVTGNVDATQLSGSFSGSYEGNGANIAGTTHFKSVTIESPTDSENILMFRAPYALTIVGVHTVLKGTSPTVTWQVRHNSDSSGAGTDLFTANKQTTSTTTGEEDTGTINDATVADNEWVWVITSATSGTVDMFNLTIEYTKD